MFRDLDLGAGRDFGEKLAGVSFRFACADGSYSRHPEPTGRRLVNGTVDRA